MNDKFRPTPLHTLLQIIINQFNTQESIFGIPKESFFVPQSSDPFSMRKFGHMLESPIGLAAGPHTQLSQNIIAAWLCGARYIELKTIQTLDELEVSKPCIDMQDEGYNCEWSQELKIYQSFDQYLNAWIIIHVLKHMFEKKPFNNPGFIFNMSVGYNLEGIKKENVQWFLNKMRNASIEIKQKTESLKAIYPKITEINIDPCISNNITLSTMHGCPPDEIEKIAHYLLTEKKLHTFIKLNPTLLGKADLHAIMNQSGFETIVPDVAFEHDLKYTEAIEIIKNLRIVAESEGLQFGLKLTNTLECYNNREVFPEREKMMYMSGIPLHPISIKLAKKLQKEFNGSLNISFSAGVDAFNISEVISCGLFPATVCSDILKPGGYQRLNQYIENLRNSFTDFQSKNIEEFISKRSTPIKSALNEAILINLESYDLSIQSNNDYRKKYLKSPGIKTPKVLSKFDCIHAPCESTCPTHQSIPSYMYYTAISDFETAKKVILQTNPFPKTTGMVCDHTCQTKCTRINFDSPLLIREIKRSIAEFSDYSITLKDRPKSANVKVAIIGAGPSGLTCACYLSLYGLDVNIYEKNQEAGGMAFGAIPKFRLEEQAIKSDIENIIRLGVKIHYNKLIDRELFDNLILTHDFVYIAAGAQSSRSFPIKGSESSFVLNPLEFLSMAKTNKPCHIGKNIVIIGGGNTAMDAARTAKRLAGEKGRVTLLYRRTIKEMPANEEEIKALINEKIEIQELINPLEIIPLKDKQVSLLCQKMKLGEKDSSGRARPIPIEGSEFEIECDTIIPAVGQETDLNFVETEMIENSLDYKTQIPNVYIGGDALNGGLSVIAAVADGRNVAQKIIEKINISDQTQSKIPRPQSDYKDLMLKKTKRIKPINPKELNLENRNGFELIESSLSQQEAINEASRCLLCDELCNICTTVCPNLALFAYQTKPFAVNDEKENCLFRIKQNTQIIHIADWCNHCGNCNTFCPTAGAPFEQKPHLFLEKSEFDNANEGYHITNNKIEQTLYYKSNGEIESLTENNLNYSYIAKGFKAQIEKQSFKIQEIKDINPEKIINLSRVIEMSIILDGAMQFLGLKG